MGTAGIVSAKGLSVKAGSNVLIQPLNLSFCSGEFVGVLGPSGCGKSTLLRCLAGLQAPSTGEVYLGGQKFEKLTPQERRKIGFVPQDDVVHGSLKVERALNYTGRLMGLTGQELTSRVAQVIELLELQERRAVRTDRLSGGQRKRVSIAMELLGEPQVLFLDEPTAGLDPALEDSFMVNCRKLCQGGRTLLMSTHVMQSLDALDLVLVLLKGHLIFLGPPQQGLSYFQVPSLSMIYKQLSQQDPLAAQQRYAASSLFQTYVAGRAP
ncbi:ABC transporter ATP-binding protein [bacterium]|nr:ABC transporter ATP-binding protein [bacterium]